MLTHAHLTHSVIQQIYQPLATLTDILIKHMASFTGNSKEKAVEFQPKF